MNGTGPKEMRELLSKYWALMQDALDVGLEMLISTKLKENGRPWFYGYVHEVGAGFESNGINHLDFSAYEWRAVESNEAELKTVEEFINKHKK